MVGSINDKNKKSSSNTIFMTFLSWKSCFLDILRKHSHKKSNFVEESLDAELNVIWIPAHYRNTNSEQTYLFYFVYVIVVELLCNLDSCTLLENTF